jgi:hypothetical protein
MRRYIGLDILRQSRLTIINSDADTTAEEVLPTAAITAQHPTNNGSCGGQLRHHDSGRDRGKPPTPPRSWSDRTVPGWRCRRSPIVRHRKGGPEDGRSGDVPGIRSAGPARPPKIRPSMLFPAPRGHLKDRNSGSLTFSRESGRDLVAFRPTHRRPLRSRNTGHRESVILARPTFRPGGGGTIKPIRVDGFPQSTCRALT